MEGHHNKREAALTQPESPIRHDASLTANYGHSGSCLAAQVADAAFISNNANNNHHTNAFVSGVDVNPGSFAADAPLQHDHLVINSPTIGISEVFKLCGTSEAFKFRFRNEDEFFQAFPSGYRFKPYDEELVVNYLDRKIRNQELPPNRMKEVELYKYNPETLAAHYEPCGEKEWYFLTPRDRKYRNGERPNRKAGDGYWKATGADKVVHFEGKKVGYRKALVFYRGKPPKGTKTDWIMHEFRVDNPPKRQRAGNNDMRLDDWVLCRIYKKVDKSSKPPNRQRDNAVPDQPSGPQVSEPNLVDSAFMAMTDINGIYSEMGFLEPFDNFGYPVSDAGLLRDPRNELLRLPECMDVPLDQASPYVRKIIYDHSNPVTTDSPSSKPSTQNMMQTQQLNEFHEDEVLSDQRQENYDFLSSDSLMSDIGNN